MGPWTTETRLFQKNYISAKDMMKLRERYVRDGWPALLISFSWV
jgi:hypothetical protein